MTLQLDLQAACCELLTNVVRETGTGSLKVTGLSMLPTIRPGDILLIERVKPEPFGNSGLCPGQVILFHRDGRLWAHRIVKISGEQIRTWGDSVPKMDPPVQLSQVIGCVTRIQRKSRVLSPDRSFLQRVAGLILRRSDLCLKLYLRLQAKTPKVSSSAAKLEY